MEVSMPLKSLAELADLVGGRLVGDETVMISAALPLQDAGPGCLTLADSPKQLARVQQSPAAAVLVPADLRDCGKPLLIVNDLHAAFQTIIHALRPHRTPQVSHVDPTANVHPSATIGQGVRIGAGTHVGPGATIGDGCSIGDDCRLHAGVHLLPGCHLGAGCELYPNVVLYEETRLGQRVLIHASAILGAFGFGYKTRDGAHHRTAQLGWVEVADDVEIGAGTTIDRGTYGPTRIGAGSKLDNQVQIGHNCHIGRHNLICAQVGIAGSCSTGDYVVMAGQVGMADHIHLADRVTIGAQAGVMQDVPAGMIMFGSPASPSKQKMQEVAIASRLPEMRRELKQMKRQLAALSQQVAAEQEAETASNHSAAEPPLDGRQQAA